MRATRRAASAAVLLATILASSIATARAQSNGTNQECIRGSATSGADERTLSRFSEVAVSGALRVTIASGKARRVVVRGDDNLVAHVTTKVGGRRLVISLEQRVCPSQELHVEIDVEGLEALEAAGSATVAAGGVETQRLRVDSAGNASVTLAGRVGHLDAALTGAGKLDAYELEAQSVKIAVEGSGNADVHAAKSLSAKIVGSGNVRYAGRPKSIEKQITGMGDVSPL